LFYFVFCRAQDEAGECCGVLDMNALSGMVDWVLTYSPIHNFSSFFIYFPIATLHSRAWLFEVKFNSIN